MQTRNASRMRSNGPGELLADLGGGRGGRIHGTGAVGSKSGGRYEEEQ